MSQHYGKTTLLYIFEESYETLSQTQTYGNAHWCLSCMRDPILDILHHTRTEQLVMLHVSHVIPSRCLGYSEVICTICTRLAIFELNWQQNFLQPYPVGCKWRVVLPQVSTAGFFHGHIMLLEDRNQLLLLLLNLFFRWGSTSICQIRMLSKQNFTTQTNLGPSKAGKCCETGPSVRSVPGTVVVHGQGICNCQYAAHGRSWYQCNLLTADTDIYNSNVNCYSCVFLVHQT